MPLNISRTRSCDGARTLTPSMVWALRSVGMGLDMPLEEAMRTQRAIRRLKPDPVDDALILKCIELALKAPTGSNAQNWEFVVVKDRAVKAKLARLNRTAWAAYGGIGRWMARRQGDDKM